MGESKILEYLSQAEEIRDSIPHDVLARWVQGH